MKLFSKTGNGVNLAHKKYFTIPRLGGNLGPMQNVLEQADSMGTAYIHWE